VQVADIAIVLRPRRPQEAFDLGVAMFRRWWRPIMLAWLFTGLPVALFAAFVTQSFWWTALALFLLEPAFERVTLFVISRAIFGAVPDPAGCVRALPSIWGRTLFTTYLGHRLSTVRTVIAPVAQLEGLRGSERRQREALLARRLSGAPLAMALALRSIHLALVFAALALLTLFVPAEHIPTPDEFLELRAAGAFGWLPWFMLASWIIAHGFTTALGAVCGFALYLQRRTELEGWDVEVAFRRMAERLARRRGDVLTRVGAALLVCCGLALGGRAEAAASIHAVERPAPSRSVQDERSPKDAVAEVLAHPDFETTDQRTEWRLPFETGDLSGTAPAGAGALAALLEVLMWAAVVTLAAFAVYHLARSAGWIQAAVKEPAPMPSSVDVVLGLDVRPESLPGDVPGTVLGLWGRGEHAEAIGLLYRATLIRLAERERVEFAASDTERDCLRRAQVALAKQEIEGQPEGKLTAFTDVTRAWLLTAYSDQRPRDEEVARLCREWSLHFDVRHATEARARRA
jgi:hypothetical protein